jgi:hypothetical protein
MGRIGHMGQPPRPGQFHHTWRGSGALGTARPTLFHAGEFGVANQVLLQVRVDRALTAKPGESAFGLVAQMNLFEFGFLDRWGAFEFDFDEGGAWGAGGCGLGVLTAGRDELGLGERVGGEDFQESGEVLIGELMGLAAEEAATLPGVSSPSGRR